MHNVSKFNALYLICPAVRQIKRDTWGLSKPSVWGMANSKVSQCFQVNPSEIFTAFESQHLKVRGFTFRGQNVYYVHAYTKWLDGFRAQWFSFLHLPQIRWGYFIWFFPCVFRVCVFHELTTASTVFSLDVFYLLINGYALKDTVQRGLSQGLTL